MSIDTLFDAVEQGATRGLLFTGEPGIGRTTLLDDARERAAERGWTVLAARGDPGGAEHPFDALGALVRQASDGLASLPSKLASALDIALGIEHGQTEPTTIGAAFLRLLTDAAATRPVLLALDDVHWFDESSVWALSFVHRHLAGERVATVATAHVGDEAVERTWGRTLATTALAGLELDELAPLVLEYEIAPSVMEQCRRHTLGNPLGFVELVRRLSPPQRLGTEPLPALHDPGPVVTRAFAARLGRLPERTRRALTVAAADESRRMQVVATALATLGAASDLEPAEGAGIITIENGTITFTHPLLRAAAYHGVAVNSRRAAHRALAAALNHPADAELRAWQLAAAAAGPDEDVAAALTMLADRAVARGADASAARVLEQAAALSPAPRQGAARLTAAGELWLRARDLRAATDALERASGLMATAELPVGTHLWCAIARRWSSGPAAAEAWLRAAAAQSSADADVLLAAAQDERRLAAVAPMGRAPTSSWPDGGQATTNGRAAHDRARMRRAADLSFGTLADVRSVGDVIGPLALGSPLALDGAAWGARAMVHDGRLLGAYGVLTAALAADPGTIPGARVGAELELARIESLVGRQVEAFARLDRVEAISASLGMGRLQMAARAVRGLHALGSAQFEQAVTLLAPIAGDGGPQEPDVAADHAEALAGTERSTGARPWSPGVGSVASAPGSLAAGLVLRANGLIHRDRALVEEAAAALEHFPFEHARTMLLLAERWGVSGAADEARQAFESMAASMWAARAGRVLHRASPAGSAAAVLGSLTAAELRVAIAVGSGKSNREAADELFLSVKTIDHHLQRIYRKLEIKGRSSLAVMVTAGSAHHVAATVPSSVARRRGDQAPIPPTVTSVGDARLEWLPPAVASGAEDDPWAATDVPEVSLSGEQLDFLRWFAEQPVPPRVRGLADPFASFDTS